jgi:hypothetical protein
MLEKSTLTETLGEPELISQPRFTTRRMTLLLLTLVLLSSMTSACFESKIVASKVNPTDKDKVSAPTEMDGVFYALPRTVVKVDVPVVRVDKAPGQFAKFTKCFFPELVAGDDYPTTSSTEFKIAADKIKFDTTFVPDTDET